MIRFNRPNEKEEESNCTIKIICNKLAFQTTHVKYYI